jgi:hypothetical protein
MKRKTKEKKLKVIYKQADNISEEETLRRLDKAFDVLFNEVLRRRREKR